MKLTKNNFYQENHTFGQSLFGVQFVSRGRGGGGVVFERPLFVDGPSELAIMV